MVPQSSSSASHCSLERVTAWVCMKKPTLGAYNDSVYNCPNLEVLIIWWTEEHTGTSFLSNGRDPTPGIEQRTIPVMHNKWHAADSQDSRVVASLCHLGKAKRDRDSKHRWALETRIGEAPFGGEMPYNYVLSGSGFVALYVFQNSENMNIWKTYTWSFTWINYTWLSQTTSFYTQE